MHLRKLVWVCGFACMLLSNVAAALGLGEVRLNSKLNEPLNAEIKLLDTRGLSASQIIVTLASPADFERNGVDRPYFLTEFQFEVLLNNPGGAAVQITSRSPVREPFVNFLVEARWPTGRLLREYTLLMDLPTFSESAAASPVQAPAARPAPAATAPAPAAQSRTAAPARPSVTPAPATQMRSGESGNSYTVGRNDTLWQIALDVRPDSSYSVHQTMLAIQRLNPDAFINGNINLLRNGQVLRIPSGDDIQAMSRSEAVNEVARQNQAWSDEGMGAQLSASRPDNTRRRGTGDVSGSVRLATPGQSDASSGQGSGDDTGRGRALESELAASLEELDKTKSENYELTSRVRDLEEQIKTMERLVEVSNEQLRAMQLNAAQNDQAATGDADAQDSDPYAAESSANENAAGQEDMADQAVDEESSVAVEQEPAVIEEPPVVSAPVPADERRVVAPPQPTKTLVDHIMENLLWILLAILVVVALIGAVVYRRRQAADSDAMADEDFFDMEPQVDAEEFDSALHDETEDVDTDEAPLFDEEEIPAEAETGDVVGEADIYIAYGKFDQAEEMLLAGLAKDPESVDIRLKLLEVYSQTQNARKFDLYYAGLIGLAGQPALARAAELREHIVDAGEFDPAAAAPYESSSDSIDISAVDDAIDLNDASGTLDGETPEDELDFDLDLDEETSPLLEDEQFADASDLHSVGTRYDLSFDEPAPAVAADEEFSFDFDLDDAPASEPEPAAAVEAGDDEDFSFELDELESDAAQESEPASDISLDLSDELEDLDVELEEPVDTLAQDVAPAPTSDDTPDEESGEELLLPDDNADEFNLDMEMGDLDLAALDEEMDALDEDFTVAEEADELELELGEKADALVEEENTELAFLSNDLNAEDELNFDDLEDQPQAAAPVSESVENDEEDVFDQALSELATDSADTEMPELDDLSDEDMDAELDFLADADEAATKLDLARAYIDMGDTDGARDILSEVAHEGNEQQRQEAVDLLSRIDA